MAECTDPEIGSLLHAYEVGALSETDAKRFEVHILGCEQCFRRIKDFEYEAALLFEDEDVKEMVDRIDRAHLRRHSPAGRLWRYLWPKAPLIFKPAIAYLLILLMVIPAYRGVMRSDHEGFDQTSSQFALLDDNLDVNANGPESRDGLGDRINDLARRLALDDLRKGAAELANRLASANLAASLKDRIEALGAGSASSITLTCLRSAAVQTLSRSESPWAKITFAFGEAIEGREYIVKVELEGADEPVYEDSAFAGFNDLGMGTLYMPIALFELGEYRLTIVDTEAEPPLNRQVHYFVIKE
jgi:hypothetical protein